MSDIACRDHLALVWLADTADSGTIQLAAGRMQNYESEPLGERDRADYADAAQYLLDLDRKYHG